MSRAESSTRRRVLRVGLAAAALIVVAVGGTFLASTPATATWTDFEATATCDCVLKQGERYKAVFGYANSTTKIGEFEAGQYNAVSGSTGTEVVTRFEPGTHKAAFASGWVGRNEVVTWTIGSQRVVATWDKPTCGPSVSLPAGGNGSGPVIALAASLLIAAGVVLTRKFRLTARAD